MGVEQVDHESLPVNRDRLSRTTLAAFTPSSEAITAGLSGLY
ncbi:MAG TPA: hypothetical protein VK206_28580 [Anaerolineales bacterium]|nr:hypothetical protein [Anaerolineales bacterium]